MIVEMLQFFLALAEIGVCFWACDKLIYHGEVVGRHRWYIIICTFIISGFVVWNRTITFASFLVLLAGVAMIWGLIYAYTRKKALLSFMFILDYLLLTSLLDLALSFFAISILGDGYWNKIYYRASLGRIIIYVISRVIMITSCYVLQLYAKKLKFDIDSYRGALFGLGTVGGIWWWWLLTTLLDRGGANSLGDSFFVITCLVILLTLMVIELKSIYLKSQAQMIQMKNELLEKNYDNFYGLYENSRYVYHDFKNHMILLKNYMEHNEYDKAQQYLENIVTPLEELSNYTFCDSQVLNLVLNVKGYEANQKGVRFWADIESRLCRKIDENDLGIIFFNLLDNAIEACDKIENKEKWIHVAIKKKKQVMIIKIENSIEKQIIMKDGKYVTEKHNKAIHGLGLQSVKSLVEKYDGEVHCSHTEEIFTVVITFFENGL
ncbi:sensor histidine kinase [Extibacter sp. GGCC_0201]|uniref:sensor histidine kinase n=1 Tax=Extibacter sp. GGCC_0201 TaxID=2731209 RepID=UPI001AA12FF4|nr:GHKL domain-containing protein [Extibacter sp. GGCC_0201]MBO1720877.1 GHKL domain-containing protein [Extibacter sp. GGCC_0201]